MNISQHFVLLIMTTSLTLGLFSTRTMAAPTSSPQAPRDDTITGPLGRKLDAYVASQTQNGFSGAVLAVKDGQVALHKGYGQANREGGIPNTTETVFDVASFAQGFTWQPS